MRYYLNIFSPTTYSAFSKSDKKLSGFQRSHFNQANQIHPGDTFICYLTRLSCWIGVMEVTSDCFRDDTSLYSADDPFMVRFTVSPLVWLDLEHCIPIRTPKIWNHLSFTKGKDPSGASWTAPLRSSLSLLIEEDGIFLENQLHLQGKDLVQYPLDKVDKLKLKPRRRGIDGRYLTQTERHPQEIEAKPTLQLPVPHDSQELDESPETQCEVRESIKIQALVAKIGSTMGLQIWIPRNDRARVLSELKNNNISLIETLPLHYDGKTLQTIEQIDVLWLKGREIIRAFEVEHTTSIYSGILRMADLRSLIPNSNIKLHIVAPNERKSKVNQELHRPVFSIPELGRLFTKCSYLSYESVRELANERLLSYMSESVLDNYSVIMDLPL